MEINNNVAITADGELKGPSINFEIPKGGLGNLIFHACEKYRSKILHVCSVTDEAETFESYKTRSIKVALEMRRRGVKNGDVILSCTPNTLDNSLPITAALYLGAIVSSLDPSLSDRDCAHLIKLIEPKMIFVHQDSVQLINCAYEINACNKPEIVVYGSSGEYVNFTEFLKDEDTDDFKPVVLTNPKQTAIILFSSGTTGLPKGICISHESILFGSYSFMHSIAGSTALLHYSTFYWLSAILMYIITFIAGNQRILAAPFNVETFFKIIEKYKISSIFLSTNLGYKITQIKDPSKYDSSSLRFLVLGGSPMSTEQVIKIRKALPNTYCILGYGMTELAAFCSTFALHEKDLAEKHPNSCGRPIAETTVKVLDLETEEKLGVGQSGEIRLKTPYIMNGYHKQNTADAFDGEGYLKTGDIGHYDTDGCLYIYDRIKDMFKYQSFHIVPASIESVIKEHPAVSEAVVFGLPHTEDGDIPAAAVTLSDDQATAQDIIDFVALKVADRQKLRGGVFIFKEIPTTPTGKLQRKKIKEEVLMRLNQRS